LKSIVVLDRLAFLLVDVLVDHLIADRAGGDRKVAACPEVPTPELALEMRELLEEKARAGEGVLGDRGVNDRPDRRLLDVGQHPDHHLAATLQQARDRWLLFR